MAVTSISTKFHFLVREKINYYIDLVYNLYINYRKRGYDESTFPYKLALTIQSRIL